MAGLGRKEFNAGDILLASEVQGYLQDQAVMVFDDAAARGSAIPSPSEGMLTYNKDTSGLELYDGSAFGPVGSDAGLIHINTTTFSAVASQSVNDVFSATYKNYLIKVVGTIASGNDVAIRFRVSGTDSTANYNTQQLLVSASTLTGSRATGQSSGVFGNWDTTFNGNEIFVYNPFTTEQTMFRSISTNSNNTVTINERAGRHAVNTAYDGFTILSGSNITGTIYVYGFKE